MTTYVFENAWENTKRRLHRVEAQYDANTFRHLDALGISPGWHCLEVGAGAGSVSRWLAARVGPSGRVVALDKDTRFLTDVAANVELLQADVLEADVPSGAFDLVTARLFVHHLPPVLREKVLDKMVAALRPGGWLLIEDFDHICTFATSELFLRANSAIRQVLEDAGADTVYGRKHANAVRQRGMINVLSEGHVAFYGKGTNVNEIWVTALHQTRPKILEQGLLTEAELDAAIRELMEGAFDGMAPMMVSTSAQRPVV